MRELAQWLTEAVSVVEGCGELDAELLLQQGITSLEDLAECETELLTSLPGIDGAGAQRIRERAAELAERKKAEEEEAARLEAERVAQEEEAARLEAERVAQEAAAAEAGAEAGEPSSETDEAASEEKDG